jgi:tripartite-type tricarboxylate transporter receptor subunit TctC
MISTLAWRVALTALLSLAGAAAAQTTYPAKPIRMIVGFPPGGPTDLVARLVAPKLTEILGQQVVIDNRPGAGGTIGASILVKSVPDGYTLFTAANGEIAIAPSLYPKLPYDPTRDLAPVSRIGSSQLMLAVHPGVAATSVKELIALAKSKPGVINFASGGIGSTPHLASELLKTLAAIDIIHVPYKGGGPAISEVMGGQVQMLISGVPAVMPHAKAGRLRALATTGDKRLAVWPELPTLGETVPGYQVNSWFGVFAPKDTPKDVIARLHGAIAAVATDADISERMGAMGMEAEGTDPVRFGAQVREEIAKWARVVKTARVKLD